MACLLMSELARELCNFNSPNVPNGVPDSSTHCALLLHLPRAPSFENLFLEESSLLSLFF